MINTSPIEPADPDNNQGPVSCTRCWGSGLEPADPPENAPGFNTATIPENETSDSDSNGLASKGNGGTIDGSGNGVASGDSPQANGTAHEKIGKAICGRRTKSCRKCKRKYTRDEYDLWICPDCETDRRCQYSPSKYAAPGGPCKWHGGMALPAGPMHPTWKHGRYSKVTPAHMLATYQESLKDEQLLSIRDEIALHNAMIVERLGRLKELEPSSKTWNKLKKTAAAINAARSDGDMDKMAKLLPRLMKQIDDGAKPDEVIKEISSLCLGKGKLTTSEFHRLRDMHQLITQERATAMIVSLASSVREHCTDPEQLRKIAYDFSLQLGPPKAGFGNGPDESVDAEFSDPG